MTIDLRHILARYVASIMILSMFNPIINFQCNDIE